MKRRQSSVDGFITRRLNNNLGVRSERTKRASHAAEHPFGRPLLHNSGDLKQKRQRLGELGGLGLARSDIAESLKDVDIKAEQQPAKKMSRREMRKLKKLSKKPHPIRRRIVRIIITLIVLGIFGTGGYMGYKLLSTSHNIIQGNILDIFKTQKLKEDSNGRSNFLIVGTSEDDPGHDAGNLTDSILIVSIDQTNKNMFMFSVPRDLYVEYGTACASGYSGKINVYFSCVNDGKTAADEQDRLTKMQSFIGQIFGLDIQYGIHADWTVVKDVVNAIGGIDVDVEGSNGDPGVLDRNADWRCNYKCYYVKYTNGVHHLDGEHALYLAMARGDMAPTYGLGNSNFDREKNQQKIIIASLHKASSAGVLTNIGSVTKILDSLGSNLRTNIQTSEIQTLMNVAKDIKSTDIHMISLIDNSNPMMKTGMYGGASVVMPSAGIFDYSEIQSYIKKNISSDPAVREAAPIVVLNGTGQAGYAKKKADELAAKGYTISSVDNAPDGTYDKVEVYQIGTSSPETAKKLAALYGVKVKTTTPPISVSSDVQFVIIFGATDDTSTTN